mmetsp:Transcript_59919/g.122985  ORF Transcript_59919/g.122985 Transcript_59919/m.122985 type:complete len:92 (+) Transcript_59919:609-884(+)
MDREEGDVELDRELERRGRPLPGICCHPCLPASVIVDQPQTKSISMENSLQSRYKTNQYIYIYKQTNKKANRDGMSHQWHRKVSISKVLKF